MEFLKLGITSKILRNAPSTKKNGERNHFLSPIGDSFFLNLNLKMSLISMISESRAERFVRLLQDYRTNVDVDYRTLVTQERKFEEHRKLHALLQKVTFDPLYVRSR